MSDSYPFEEKYAPTYCDDCGKKRCPPEMDVCPYCHPNAPYQEEADER